MNKEIFEQITPIEYVNIEPTKSEIDFKIQDGPIKESGVNGCQIEALGQVWLEVIRGFNKKFPCRENSITITKIEEALLWQQKRKQDRELRKVEGLNKP